jgi:hypothetical protein
MGGGAVGVGTLGWVARVVEADLAGRDQGAVGLARFFGQQSVALRRLKQDLVDLVVL